jgi:ABC-type Fe3+-hydroxamate transport system substrate-binding protein
VRAPSIGLVAVLGLCGFALVLSLAHPVALVSRRNVELGEDMVGRKVRLDMPRRILFAANAMPAFATLVGDLNRIVAATWLGRSGMNHVLLDRIFAGMQAIPFAGQMRLLEPERTLLLAPDAILGWAGQADALISTGYPCFVTLASDGSNQGDLNLWNFLAEISGADQRIKALRARVAAASFSRAQTIGEKPTRVLVLLSNTREIWIGPQRLPLTRRLKAAGARNEAPRGAGSAVDIEEIARIDPDVILISTSFANLAPRDLFEEPRWRVSTAVRGRKVASCARHRRRRAADAGRE